MGLLLACYGMVVVIHAAFVGRPSSIFSGILITASGLVWWNVDRQMRLPGPDFTEADDIRPERRAEIARRVADQLATQRTLCSAHVWDERGVCRLCKTTRPISPFVDRHVAFPEEDQ